ncbi:M91 family zinc metallopeptidase [Hamadaea tsunoensis]|uniref:M91 family zinc metallopeptidase n=1 Tax=Hamadaea tsunoensis TaxID=53368 RepID=UPI000481E167|nr:M91 family zinc metallopeptidase [Hamadaea tsunoensis]
MRPVELPVPDHWSLPADPGGFADAAAAWSAVADAKELGVDAWSRRAATITKGWQGPTAVSYSAHRTGAERDLRTCDALAGRIAGALRASAAAVARTRGLLAEHYAAVTGVLDIRAHAEGELRLRVREQSDVELMRVAVRQAARIRTALATELSDQAGVLLGTVPEWNRIAGAWRDAAEGADTFTTPAESGRTMVLRDGHRVVISTGRGDDEVSVRVDPLTGEDVVSTGLGTWRFPKDSDIVLRTGDGDDTVTVAPGTRVRVTVLGGSGDDVLQGGGGGVLLGSTGADYLAGGTGADLLDGGAGDDTVAGLGGDDQLSGGEGHDFLDGGPGSDVVDGDAGPDAVTGGTGVDRISGGAGDDTLYADTRKDTVDGGDGRDTAYRPDGVATDAVERSVTVEVSHAGTHIQVEGSPAFVQRVQADLDLLRVSPDGQRMLAELDQGIHGRDTLTIREFAEQNGSAYPDTSAAAGAQRAIDYNPTFSTFLGDTPPVVVLYHEMAHQYDFMNGTALAGTYHDPLDPDRIPLGHGRFEDVPNAERQAVGLPVDDDGNPATPTRIDPDHPIAFTENGLRTELGWRLRAHYGR